MTGAGYDWGGGVTTFGVVKIPPFDGGLTCIVSTSVVHYKNATHTQK